MTQTEIHAIPKVACEAGRQGRCGQCTAYPRCIGGHLSERARHALGDIHATARIVRRDDHMYRAGDAFESLYVVKAGCIKTYVHNEAGDEQIMGFYLPGEIIGFDGMARNRHAANAVAVDTGAVCELPRARLDRLASDTPEVNSAMMQWCGAELARMQRLAQSMATRSAAGRMAAFLMDLSDYFGAHGFSAARFTLPMLRGDIGRHLGLAVETVSRVVNRLRRDGVVDIQRQSVVILDPAALQALADPGGVDGHGDGGGQRTLSVQA